MSYPKLPVLYETNMDENVELKHGIKINQFCLLHPTLVIKMHHGPLSRLLQNLSA
jgi:hypothetical protein